MAFLLAIWPQRVKLFLVFFVCITVFVGSLPFLSRGTLHREWTWRLSQFFLQPQILRLIPPEQLNLRHLPLTLILSILKFLLRSHNYVGLFSSRFVTVDAFLVDAVFADGGEHPPFWFLLGQGNNEQGEGEDEAFCGDCFGEGDGTSVLCDYLQGSYY